jgi:hypothetical protein
VRRDNKSIDGNIKERLVVAEEEVFMSVEGGKRSHTLTFGRRACLHEFKWRLRLDGDGCPGRSGMSRSGMCRRVKG